MSGFPTDSSSVSVSKVALLSATTFPMNINQLGNFVAASAAGATHAIVSINAPTPGWAPISPTSIVLRLEGSANGTHWHLIESTATGGNISGGNITQAVFSTFINTFGITVAGTPTAFPHYRVRVSATQATIAGPTTVTNLIDYAWPADVTLFLYAAVSVVTADTADS